MSEKEKEIIQTISEAAPYLSERQKSFLLGYGNAILDMRREQNKREEG